MKTEREIYTAIEEVFHTFVERRFKELTGRKDLSDGELRQVRGQAQAAMELRTLLQNHLGYSDHEL